MNRKISVIIPVWNQLGYSRICMDYLIRNTPGFFEIIIVDNGSGDDTRGYFEGLEGNFDLVYVRNAENLGPIVALNQGIEKATSDIVAAMHNDLIMFEYDWTEKLASVIESDDSIGLAGIAGRRKIDKRGVVDEASLVHSLINEDLNAPMEAESAGVAVLDGVFISGRRAFFKKIGGFDEAYGLMHLYDLDISLKSIAAGARNVIVNMEAMHIYNGGVTRKTRQYKKLVPDDTKLLNKNSRIFFDKWRKFLPVEV